MKNICRRIALKRQRGSAAVEAAVIIPLILVPLLAFVLLLGRYFWYYTVAQKAVHDGVLALATSSLADVRSNAASGLALQIIRNETADLDAATASTLGVTTECWFRVPANSAFVSPFACSTNASLAIVRTSVSMTVTDPFLSGITGPVLGTDGLTIMTGVTMRYVGR
jgi:Flp pilus assembly protein TadG